MYSANYKMPTKLMEITALLGTIEIYNNTCYTWCGQKGFFVKEDDNLFAWCPGPEGKGTPSYYNREHIQHICISYGVPYISK
jgi:hypothetical protein